MSSRSLFAKMEPRNVIVRGLAVGFRMALCLLFVALARPASAQDRLALFDEVASLVKINFFDPAMNGLDWEAVTAEHRARIAPAMKREAFAAEVNAMLARLRTSHTQLITQDHPAWYQLAGVFLPGNAPLAAKMAPYLSEGAPVYAGIGVMLENRSQGQFVTGVLDGYPASKAGILVGDRLVSVAGDPFHPIRSFRSRSGQAVRISVERRPGQIRELTLTPALLDGRTMFEAAMRASIRVIEHKRIRIGYIHAWSYAGQVYQDILTSALLYGRLKDTDALVLDIRNGWGGANPSYLNLFTDRSLEFSSIRRDGTVLSFDSGWTKPVVLLVDEGARSGKELIAHGFRSLGIGPVVGERTAGAVVSGLLNVLSDGSLLYIAVADVKIAGNRLEGRGVTPDIEVPFDPTYAAGADPQLERAVGAAAVLTKK